MNNQNQTRTLSKAPARLARGRKPATTEALPPDSPATDDQVSFLIKRGKWDYNAAASLSSIDASLEITAIIDESRRRRAEPPTDFQVAFLVKHGAREAVVRKLTKGICSTMIYKIKNPEAQSKKKQPA